MALNDHVLKYRYPGMITGKLSDFTGIFYFPIFLAALAVLVSGKGLSRGLTLATIGCADILLIAVKTSPAFAAFVDATLTTHLFESRIIADPTDLVALAMNYPTYRHCAHYFTSASATERAPRT